MSAIPLTARPCTCQIQSRGECLTCREWLRIWCRLLLRRLVYQDGSVLIDGKSAEKQA